MIINFNRNLLLNLIAVPIILLSVFCVILLDIDHYKSEKNLKEFTYLNPSDIQNIHINYMFSKNNYIDIYDKNTIKDIFYSINIKNIKYYKERRTYPMSLNIIFLTRDNTEYSFEVYLDKRYDSFCGFYVDKKSIPIDGIDINRTLKTIVNKLE